MRGVAYRAGIGSQAPPITFDTRMGRIHSLDAATGAIDTGFGVAGMIDLKTPEGMTTGKDRPVSSL